NNFDLQLANLGVKFFDLSLAVFQSPYLVREHVSQPPLGIMLRITLPGSDQSPAVSMSLPTLDELSA
ncbi:hypothetical protein, partial [Planktotalea sp.]|uniref:hypothetical protein n=1 Tax=Planktotalea sp. TaxID=2029877 RepID=UPI003298705C